MSKLRLFVGIVALMAVMAPGTPVSAERTTYTTDAVTLGTEGFAPSHPNGWWRNTYAMSLSADDFTSYCAHPSNGYHYGVLTHPHGYEIVLVDGESVYGDNAYKMYGGGWIKAANVRESDGKLQAPGRIDTCRAPGAPEQEPPPPPPPPPLGLAGGNDAIVGTYSCNVVRADAGSSQVHLGEDGTFTVTPDRAATSSEELLQGTEPRQGTWWSYPGDPEDGGEGVSLRDGVFIHFEGDTSRFTIEEDRLVISGFVCTSLESTR